MLSQQEVNAIVAMAVGIIASKIAGYNNGHLTAKAKLPAFIVTLGSFTYIRGLAYVLSEGYPIALSDPLFKFFGYGTVSAISYTCFYYGVRICKRFLNFEIYNVWSTCLCDWRK